MKIEEREKNEIKIRVDNIDDLWYLKMILKPGDYVYGTVYRKEDKGEDMTRAKKERRKLRVKIQVERVEFQEFSDRLRIIGKIVGGDENYMGLYQAINVGVGDEISVVKEWNDEEIQLLKEAVENSERPEIYFLGLEHGLATIAILRSYGIQEIATIRKRGDEDEEFFGEVLSALKNVWKDEKPLIILGPGFYKENFVKFAGDELKNYIVVQASHGDMRGIHEVLKSSANKLIERTRIAKEEKLVDALLEEIKKDGLYAYGVEEVKKCLENGAVKILLVSDRKYREYESLIKLGKETRAEVHIISTSHEKGKILEHLGGIAAILRFKL